MFAARRTLSLLRAPPAGGGCACAASRRYSAHAPAMVEYLATSGTTDAIYHVNLSDIVRQHQRWVDELPRVTPHYAVKCNPDMHVLRTLADLGCGFDCASVTEMDALLDLDVAPDRIVLYGEEHAARVRDVASKVYADYKSKKGAADADVGGGRQRKRERRRRQRKKRGRSHKQRRRGQKRNSLKKKRT